MITHSQIQSFAPYIPPLNVSTRSSMISQLDMFAGILLQGCMDLWVLRWDTPFPIPFVQRVESSLALIPFFKYKLPKKSRILRTHLLKPSDDQLIRLYNAQNKVKRNTQKRLGQAITHLPKESIPDIRTGFQSMPSFLRLKTISLSLQGVAKNQCAQVHTGPTIDTYFQSTRASPLITFPHHSDSLSSLNHLLITSPDTPPSPALDQFNQIFLPGPSSNALPSNSTIAPLFLPPALHQPISSTPTPIPSYSSSTQVKRPSKPRSKRNSSSKSTTSLVVTRNKHTTTYRERVSSPVIPDTVPPDLVSPLQSENCSLEPREGVG